MKKDYYLYLAQDKKEYFTLPEGWEPLHFVETEDGAMIPSIEQMTREALSKPVRFPSLSSFAITGEKHCHHRG